jgi:hypothetical protein
MGVAYGSNERKIAILAAGALLLYGLSLGGCATSSPAGSSLMNARAEAPTSPTSAYAPLGNPPPEREDRAMTSDERAKLKQDLLAVRDRQATAAKAQGGGRHMPTPVHGAD